MPLFISDDDLSHLSTNATAVAERADAYIRQLNTELETVKAQKDADSINSEQTCSLIEHRYVSLSTEYETLQNEKSRIQSSLDDRLAELAEVQAQKHQLHLQSIGKDGELEKVAMDVSELHKSKRQLIELVEQKDLEISEKNANMTSYLDKIVKLTERAAQKDSRCSEIETELTRAQAASTRFSQEKELLERHNIWLNEELSAKVVTLTELRRTLADLEADMSAKLTDAERKFNESSTSLKWNKERVRELETKITSLQKELCSTKDAAAASEDQLSQELSTVNKLVELYKESSEEWSRKAGELEGVIKALETHSRQIENDYKERLDKEVSTRKQLENEAADLKEKLQRCEGEIESNRKSNEQNLLPLSSFTSERWIESLDSGETEDNRMLVSKIPVGVSGTALAASLLRDGWSLVKMYTKYQEAVDAFRHEQLGRKEAEDILQRVLAELEEKAGVIMDERAEHERMADAYTLINQKLQHSNSEQATLEKNILELKAVMRRHERDNNLAQKEIVDLQNQVVVLLKECRDVQLRCGSTANDYTDDNRKTAAIEFNAESGVENIISERLLTFKDINGLVEQNVQLRSLVRSLSDQIESKEIELKEKFEMGIKKHTEEAASKVAAVLQRAEEQGHMIESLHSSVAMYKRLYEEEHKQHSASSRPSNIAPDRRADLLLLVEGSQEASKKAQEKAAERVKCLEGEFEQSRREIIALRSERDKFALEANFAREKLDGVMKEADHQRNEVNGVLARNVEFSQLIVDYQRKLRESAEYVTVAEDNSRKLTMEVSILKHEKEMLSNAEKRACDEVRSLSERVHRLQASLDTIQIADEVREEARAAERRKQEEHIKQLEREWAEARKELQEERDNVRTLASDREQNLKNSLRQVEEMGKELANALRAVAAADTRAAVAEAKLLDLGKKTKYSGVKDIEMEGGSGLSSLSTNEVVEPHSTKEELVKVRVEAQANKEHMLQYKSIAEVNEAALKQMESAHESFKIEAEKLKDTLEAELLSLRERVSLLENESVMKSKEVASATAGNEEALASAFAEITTLKEEVCIKSSQIASMEVLVSALKEDLEKEHEKWRAAQANYERQVILQSETIQELTKTSQALASLQAEASELRKLSDAHKSENKELKVKWENERSVLEKSQKEAERKFDEVNEQNKILLSRLEAWHIQLAEKERGISPRSSDSDNHRDAGLQDVISYLRRSKEIAETEISLLKQERLRMKTQLESALKTLETAQASLHTERANSRALLFTDEEIKSLQLQVREMNLLRESNIQLREENKFNFEECQKSREIAQNAKAEADKLQSLLGEREIQIEGCKKEIEMHRIEKENLDRRISELLERSKNIDVEDYARLKNEVQQMEQKLKQKDVRIEELESIVSKKQETMSQLEQDIANSRLVISENEKRINELSQVEANLKGDIDRHKKMANHFKRRCEALSKEKDDISKENQALSKQLEELKQEKRSGGDNLADQVMKEKEEKDHRIQMLEKTVERFRDLLTKEKEKRVNTEKVISDSVDNVTQAKNKAFMELEKHKQALKRLSDEVEKLKLTAGSLPEGTSLVQLLSGSTLDDFATAFIAAVENFEKGTHSINSELGIGTSLLDPSFVADTSQTAAAASMASAPPPAVRPSASLTVTHPPAKATEEKERSLNLPKAPVETRKVPARRIVRPRLVKPDQPQADVDMSEAAVPSSQDSEASQTQPPVRKRLAVSSSSEQAQIQGESSADVTAPALKKSKPSDSHMENSEGQSVSLSDNLAVHVVAEEPSDVGDDLPGDLNEDTIDTEKDQVVEVAVEKLESNVSEQMDSIDDVEPQSDNNDGFEETSDKPIGIDPAFDEDKSGQGDKQSTMELEEGEREEGELEPDEEEIEGGTDVSNIVESPEKITGHPDLIETPVASPLRADDDDAQAIEALESGEITNEEKDNENDAVEETFDGSDKSNDGVDQDTMETDQLAEAPVGAASTTNLTEIDVPKQDDPNKVSVETQQASGVAVSSDGAGETASTSTVAETDDSKQESSSVTTEAEDARQASPVIGAPKLVNLQERARQRAALRQAGGLAPGGSPPPAAPTRGRGRVGVRGRAVRGRGVRGGRGPTTPGQQ